MSKECACSLSPKDPDAILDYLWDWRPYLQPDENITEATITAPGLDLNPDGHSQTENDNTIIFWLGGGTAGSIVPVSCLITTNQGRTDERTFRLAIKDR